MSSSTDSLKKKVCVTVFLDELFEEVLEEDRKELKEISEVTGSQVTLAPKPYKGPPALPLGSDENVDVSPNADTEQSQVLRPRKHRRESKFSKNRYDSFKKELTKYSCMKPGNECCEPESAVSDSDFGLDEFLELDKSAAENSRSSYSELSDLDVTEESLLSINPVQSSTRICCSKEEESSLEKFQARIDSSSSSCNKSTQFNGSGKTDEGIPKDASFQEEEQKEAEDTLAWNATDREIRLVLEQAEDGHSEEETREADRLRSCDLSPILEECLQKTVKEASDSSKEFLGRSLGVRQSASTDARELSDSYTCVFPHNKLRSGARTPKMKRVWSRAKSYAWSDGIESDFSETDCPHLTKDLDLCTIQNDALLCYSLCLKCKEDILLGRRKRENVEADALPSSADSESTVTGSSLESLDSRETDLVFRTVASKTVPGSMLNTGQEEGSIKSEGDIPVETYKRLPAVEGRNKNFAEGDTIGKPLTRDSDFMLDLETKEKILLCDEIFLKNVEEAKIIRNEIIVNRAEIKLNAQGEEDESKETEAASPPSSSAPPGTTEVLFEQNHAEFLEKTLTYAESEMVFADSENSYNEVFFRDKCFDVPSAGSGAGRTEADRTDRSRRRGRAQPNKNEICIVEFEDKLSRSRILRRMKTVEILGNDSLKEMKNISTEVILICENISDNEVCLEAWQSSASTLRSISEMKQCYLKDCKDSAMYLIEIPLRFTSGNKGKPSKSEKFFKAFDSD